MRRDAVTEQVDGNGLNKTGSQRHMLNGALELCTNSQFICKISKMEKASTSNLCSAP
jgi:hypothetical protein